MSFHECLKVKQYCAHSQNAWKRMSHLCCYSLIIIPQKHQEDKRFSSKNRWATLPRVWQPTEINGLLYLCITTACRKTHKKKKKVTSQIIVNGVLRCKENTKNYLRLPKQSRSLPNLGSLVCNAGGVSYGVCLISELEAARAVRRGM